MKKLLSLIIITLLVCSMFTFGAKAHIGEVLNTATTTTAATIDGVIGDVEWDAANSYTLTFVGGATLSVDIYIMKDDNNLYIALRWNDATPWEWDGVLLMFDFDNDGFFEDPDDDASTIDDAFCFQTNLGWWSETYTQYWTWDPIQNLSDEIPGHLGNSSSDWVFISNPGVSYAISWGDDYYTWETATPLLIFGSYSYLGFGMAIHDNSKPSTSPDWFSSWWPTTYPTLNDPGDWDAADASGMGDLDLGLPPVEADFEISVSPSSKNVAQGAFTSFTVTLTSLRGFDSYVSLTTPDLPDHMTAIFGPPSLVPDGNSTLIIETSSSTPLGTYSITINGTGGGITHLASISLTVKLTHKIAYITVKYKDGPYHPRFIYELKKRANLVTEYYQAQSYETMFLGYTFVFGNAWISLDKTYDDYDINDNNWIEIDEGEQILADGIELAKREANLDESIYNVIAVIAPGEGVNFASIGKKKTLLIGEREYAVWAHEIGHAMPSLAWWDYDGGVHPGARGDIRPWGLMGQTSNPSVPVMSYNKVIAGWLQYYPIGSTQYDEYPITLLQDMSYGDFVYRYEPAQGAAKYFIFEGRFPPDGVKQADPWYPIGYILDKVKGVEIYRVEEKGWWIWRKEYVYTVPVPYKTGTGEDIFRVTVPVGEFREFPDQGINITVYEKDSQMLLKITPLPQSETTIVTLSNILIQTSPVVEIGETIVFTHTADVDLHVYTWDGQHVGMNYVTGEYELGIEGAKSSGNVHGGGYEWIAFPDFLETYYVIDATPVKLWLEEYNTWANAFGVSTVEVLNITASVTLVHYDENGIRQESEPIPITVNLDNPTVLSVRCKLFIISNRFSIGFPKVSNQAFSNQPYFFKNF